MTASEVTPGGVYVVRYPFIRAAAWVLGDEGQSVRIDSWRPGCDGEVDALDPRGGVVLRAHGAGSLRLTCVAIATLPKPYRSRVLFTRSWVDPDGKSFGKRGLRLVTVEQFARMAQGYAHAWVVVEKGERA